MNLWLCNKNKLFFIEMDVFFYQLKIFNRKLQQICGERYLGSSQDQIHFSSSFGATAVANPNAASTAADTTVED